MDTTLLFSNKKPPATKEDKRLLKQAIDLVNHYYPEADAQEDETIKEYRQEKLTWLTSLGGRKLTPAEKKQLTEWVRI